MKEYIKEFGISIAEQERDIDSIGDSMINLLTMIMSLKKDIDSFKLSGYEGGGL